MHDILITVGIYALLGREVTTATVAAVLTVLGYSIYDTIIIFDRIRENIPLMKRGSFRQITNVSLWETIPRSLATTFITLLPIVSLLIFGGATLNDFAFALLIGIASGAYSSIFVAAPLLDWIKEREPEYARRKHEDVGEIQSVGGTVLVEQPDARERGGGAARARARAGRSDADARAGVLDGSRPPSRAPLEPPARPRPLDGAPAAYTAAHGRERQQRHAEPHTLEQLLLAGSAGSRSPPRRRTTSPTTSRAGSGSSATRCAAPCATRSRAGGREAERLGSLPSDASDKALSRLGLVRREEADDLALRVAQLEHRVRLLEKPPRLVAWPRAAVRRDECDDGDDGETPATDRPPVRDRARRDAPRLRLPDRPPAQQRQHASSPTAAAACGRCSTSSGRRSSSSGSSSRLART